MITKNDIDRFLEDAKTIFLRKLYRAETMEKYFEARDRYDSFYMEISKDDSLSEDEKRRKCMPYRKEAMKYGLLVSGDNWRKYEKELHSTMESLLIKGDVDEELMNRFPDEINYLQRKGRILVFPYEYRDEYGFDVYDGAEVCRDDKGYKHVVHRGRQLFFPEFYDDDTIRSMYLGLLSEQDEDSPHKYFGGNCDFPEGGIFVDVGAAEGIISLDIIEKASEVYLLEVSPYWINALKKTFEPYKEKIHLVKKLVGDVDGKRVITLDTLFEGCNNKDIFIKMDIEGMELDALYGARRLLKNNNCKVTCAAYHRMTMGEDLQNFFNAEGYLSEFSKGYMLFMGGASTLRNGTLERLQYPYFRKGIIRAWKEGS